MFHAKRCIERSYICLQETRLASVFEHYFGVVVNVVENSCKCSVRLVAILKPP